MSTSTARPLTGRIALVTGATSGIGKAVALELAANGATVLVHGRNPNRGVAIVEQIELLGGHARFVAADLSDPTGVTALATAVGAVDILVNNAGSELPQVLCRILLSWKDVKHAEEDRSGAPSARSASGSRAPRRVPD